MKKIFSFLFVFTILYFLPYGVKAASSYSVEMVGGTSNNQVIGTYGSYSAALDVMNRQNSNENLVATIYKDGLPIDSKYAIFKFKPGSVYKLYRNSNSSSNYTSFASSSASEAALLGYSDNGRVKIMLSGFIGWVDINSGVVTPISLMSQKMININGTGVRLRSDHSTSSSIVAKISGSYNFNYTDTYNDGTYVWYKIVYNGVSCWAAGGDWVTLYDSSIQTYYNHYGQTGNLIHHFGVYSNGSFKDSFTNLGTSPAYLTKDVRYYSFDGNYFYTNVKTMLTDYRNGVYTNSVNKDNPHYAYYLYLTSRSTSGYSASDLDSVISNAGYNASTSKMYGTGVYFKEAEEVYGTNSLLAFSTALNESSWGTSALAMNKNNLFGYGAYDSCAYECAYTYNSPRESIMDYASKSSVNYENANGKYYYGSHYGNKSSGKNVKYATDPYWGEVMASNAFKRDLNYGGKDFNSNTIGVTKKGLSGVWVFREPAQTNEGLLYVLKNPNSNDAVYDFTANIVDKVYNNGKYFYKIYTDLSDGPKYGYVEASEWNVSNSQPVINASDVTVDKGTNFDYLASVSASDKEDGNLSVSYEGSVDTSRPGEYLVTYSTVDKSNFHASKTIKVLVKDTNKIELDVSDKEIVQFDEFDYMDGVSVKNADLSDVTVEGSVNTKEVGVYNLTYRINKDNQNVSKNVSVTVIKNEVPVIEANDKQLVLGSLDYNLLDGVKALDKEDGDLTSKISIKEENVNINEEGKYSVTYTVSDRHNQSVEKMVNVYVSEKELVEGTSEFYFDSLKKVNGKLELKGYNIIKEINNTLDNEIKYYFVFENVSSGEEVKYEVSRITDSNDVFDYKENGKDYTYSWFKGEVKTDDLPLGDYILRVVSESSDYYVDSVVSNKLLNPQVSNYKSEKYVTITNDYVDSRIPVMFSVRSNDIFLKETSAFTNQYSYIDDISFTDGKLYIKGASYSSGVDLRSGANVTRSIVFENQDSFETYNYDLGVLEKGPYTISLYGKDQFGKNKDLAWYEKTIDLKDLEKGKYTIYVTNKSNISDFGELKDILMLNDYKSMNAVYNGKTYEFSLNKKARYRVELLVK